MTQVTARARIGSLASVLTVVAALTLLGASPAAGGDCADECGGQAPTGCWCDTACADMGDCCAEVCSDCPTLSHCAATTTTVAPPTTTTTLPGMGECAHCVTALLP